MFLSNMDYVPISSVDLTSFSEKKVVTASRDRASSSSECEMLSRHGCDLRITIERLCTAIVAAFLSGKYFLDFLQIVYKIFYYLGSSGWKLFTQ